MSAALDGAVRSALRGNLWIDEDVVGIRTEDAVMQVAAAQLKAIAIALSAGEPESTDGSWVLNEPFTRNDAIVAISGVSAVLANAAVMIDESREAEPAAETLEAAE